jgi:hypothetical protein
MGAPQIFVVLTSGVHARSLPLPTRRWLSRGALTARAAEREPLLDVLAAAGAAAPATGLAALRYRGQTGNAPTGWIAAADPLHLETRLRHLVLRPFQRGEVTAEEMDTILASVHRAFPDDGLQFEQVDGRGYLRTDRPVATADCSAECAGGRLPDEFMPAGRDAASFHRLQSEIQMLLHEHPVNEARRQRGQRAINTLWLWGGGTAGEEDPTRLPALVSDDPLFRGAWSSRGQQASGWTADLVDAANHRGTDTVVTVPGVDAVGQAVDPNRVLEDLYTAMRRHRIGPLTLFLGAELIVRIRQRDGLKFWRSLSPLLEDANDDD